MTGLTGFTGLALATCFAVTAPVTVTLRERAAAPAGQIVAVSIDGVKVKDATQTIELSWDRISAVSGEFADDAAPFASLAERLWRARTRMERGDLTLAEPSFEALATEFPAARGSTGLLLHGSRVSCRLLRGAQVSALEPYARFLACLTAEQLRGAVPRPRPQALENLPPRVRPDGILAPDLPPMWLDVPSLRLVADFQNDPAAGPGHALIAQYIAAAKFESGTAVALPVTPGVDAGEDGDLVHDIVIARAGDEAQRLKARESLLRRLKPGLESWRESWIRVAIGRSLIREDSADSKIAGVAEMLHAPARFVHVTPYLAGLALAESAVVLREAGATLEADRLILDLRERFPGHAALEFRPIREWHIAPPAAPIQPLQPPAPSPGGGP